MIAHGSPDESRAELPGFLARLLGWTNARAIELATRSVALAANHQAALVLRGAEDLVPIARSLHRHALGATPPFIVCDPRRGNAPASVRSPASYESGIRAVAAATGGTLCVRACRLPSDFLAASSRLQDADDVMLVVCGASDDDDGPLLVRPAPICVPPLAARKAELPRIIAEYARDAIAELNAGRAAFTDTDHAWVREHAATSLTEIEKATLRLVALRASNTTSVAAARLGMAPVSLLRWLGRRRLPPAHVATNSV
jgi:hypothetical protein